MKAPDGNPDMGGVHMGASAAWLNGVGPLTEQANYTVIRSKKSIDQYIADKVAEDTPLRSLQVGTEDMGTSAGACDGYPVRLLQHALVARRHQPAADGHQSAGDLRAHVRGGRLRSASARQSQAEAEHARFDRAGSGADAAGVSAPADNAILDEYLTNVREVELQLDRMDARAAAIPEGAAAPLGIPDNFDDHMTVTYDLMHLAFQADISRVFTFAVGHEGSSRSYAHIGIPEPHHPVTHHGDKPENIEKYAKLTTYQVEKLARVHREAQDDGRRRRHAARSARCIYFGSGMGNGNAHDRNNPPVALLGGANGRLKGNRHIAVENKEPTANLLLSFADMANAEITQIGHSTGILSL